jgi:hypothetical protein
MISYHISTGWAKKVGHCQAYDHLIFFGPPYILCYMKLNLFKHTLDVAILQTYHTLDETLAVLV